MELLRNLLFILVVIGGLLTAGMTAVGGADGRWEHEGQFRVTNTPTRVFAWLSEPELRTRWVEGLEDVRIDTIRLEKGTRMRERLELDGKFIERDWQITDYELDKRLAMQTTNDGVAWQLSFEVQHGHSGKRSLVTYKCAMQYDGNLARVIEPILESMALSDLNADFERLTQIAEASY